MRRDAAAWLGLAWLVLAAPVLAAKGDNGILWRLEHVGQRPSHLLATIHSSDRRALDLPGPVTEALGNARELAVELAVSRENIKSFSQLMLLPQDDSLPEHIGRGLFRRVVKAMRERGVSAGSVDRMKPWAVAMALSMPTSGRQPVLDQRLQSMARRQGIPVTGLESPQEQLAPFDALSQPQQRQLLEAALTDLEEVEGLHERMLDAYSNGDLRRLVALKEKTLAQGSESLRDFFEQRFIQERNARMTERMMPLLEEGGAFIAVGALHVPGILERLERRGWQVSPVH